VLLTLSIVSAIIGVAYARNHELGFGIAALIAAALPLCYPLYAIGATILKHLGAGAAGGLLIAIGALLGGATAWHAMHHASPTRQTSRHKR
jgi:uncharacterized membrane protein